MVDEYFDDEFGDGEDDENNSVAKETLEILPAPTAQTLGFELQAFVPVDEQSSDKETTVADLATVNNFLAVIHNSLPLVRTIDSLCKLSREAMRTIEVRRKVKKLPMGLPHGKGGGTFEVLD